MSDYHEKDVLERRMNRRLQRFKDDSSDNEYDVEDVEQQTTEIDPWKTSVDLPNNYKDSVEVKGTVIFEKKCKVYRQSVSGKDYWVKRGSKECTVKLISRSNYKLQIIAYPTVGSTNAVVDSSVSSAFSPSQHKVMRNTAVLKLYDVASYKFNRKFAFRFAEEDSSAFDEFLQCIHQYQAARADYLQSHPLENGEDFHPDAYNSDSVDTDAEESKGTDESKDAEESKDTEEQYAQDQDDLCGYCPLCNRYGTDQKCFCTEEGTYRIFIHDEVDDESSLESFNFEEPATQTFPNDPWKPELL